MATKVTKQMRTETSHLLPGHPGRCKNVHGHSYLWEVSLEMDQLMLNGMVEDFGDLKKAMFEAIDPYDHAIVLFAQDPLTAPLVSLLQAGGVERIIVTECMPTAENFAYLVFLELKRKYRVPKITVRVWETASSYAEYAEP